MKTYIITRFSIYDPEFKGFQMTKNLTSIEKYKADLFNPSRLNYKFACFERITLPSIINQTNQDYEWYIYASEYLPPIYKLRLQLLIQNYNKIKCVFIKSFKEFNKVDINKNQPYCTIRLDDDDGLNKNFIEVINNYKNNNKSIISFPNGIKYALSRTSIIYGDKITWKNIALGLCAIGMNIYNCGDHTKINDKYNVIYDYRENMYLLNTNIYCDSNYNFIERRLIN